MRIDGETLALRTIEREDMYRLWQLKYGEENPEWKKWDAPYFPHNRIDFEAFQTQTEVRLSADDGPSMLIMESEGQIIGIVSYYWEDKPSLWLELGITIYSPEHWSGGYGTEALTLWIDYLFGAMPLVRVGLTTWSGNNRMIRCAGKLGMTMEARIRKVRLYNGEYYDSIRMGILREEWEGR
ncbi:GNAT family N-acetyltransferase [Paenibacillus sp. JDR-2]|uniref:GNAT family N-acetyltransferase n=1 Tax=Paenibacillus sp. (strain JDR-2) TaxID=324057 RepID=UPI000166B128|nr:GNAT family protein [Paenibacillus sp. JDR-2]ACS99415.1 GCN5-related N-acetyltransferase [Paenibacillus sp. JDR-2]